MQSHPAVDHIAAGLHRCLSGNLWVVFPQRLTGNHVQGIQLGPGTGGVHDAVNHERRCFQPALGTGLVDPRQPQLTDVLVADLIERAEPLLLVGPPVADPIPGVSRRSDQRIVIDVVGSCRTLRRFLGAEPCGDQADQRDRQDEVSRDARCSLRFAPVSPRPPR